MLQLRAMILMWLKLLQSQPLRLQMSLERFWHLSLRYGCVEKIHASTSRGLVFHVVVHQWRWRFGFMVGGVAWVTVFELSSACERYVLIGGSSFVFTSINHRHIWLLCSHWQWWGPTTSYTWQTMGWLLTDCLWMEACWPGLWLPQSKPSLWNWFLSLSWTSRLLQIVMVSSQLIKQVWYIEFFLCLRGCSQIGRATAMTPPQHQWKSPLRWV